MNRQSELAATGGEVEACTKCPLAQTRNKPVFGAGKTTCPNLLLIGEGPGYNEDKTGKPFKGKAGQVLDDILTTLDIERKSIYITNVLKCRPPHNRKPYPYEATACLPYLFRQIELIQPKVIVCLGIIASVWVLDLPHNQTVRALRGHRGFYSSIPVVVTYHPAAALRTPMYRDMIEEDVTEALKIARGELVVRDNGS